MKKPKFTPVVTRVKLNPEQAVLTCACYDGGFEIVRRGRRLANSCSATRTPWRSYSTTAARAART